MSCQWCARVCVRVAACCVPQWQRNYQAAGAREAPRGVSCPLAVWCVVSVVVVHEAATRSSGMLLQMRGGPGCPGDVWGASWANTAEAVRAR